MEDIREFERETQLLLERKMAADGEVVDEDGKSIFHGIFKSITPYSISICICSANAADLSASKHSSQFQSIEKTEDTPMFPKKLPETPQLKEQPPSIDSSDGEDDIIPLPHSKPRKERSASGQSQHSKYSSRHGLHSSNSSTHSFTDLQVMGNFYSFALSIVFLLVLRYSNGVHVCVLLQFDK